MLCGIGLSKAPCITLEHGQVAMDMIRSIKKLADLNNILNPSKVAHETAESNKTINLL